MITYELTLKIDYFRTISWVGTQTQEFKSLMDALRFKRFLESELECNEGVLNYDIQIVQVIRNSIP